MDELVTRFGKMSKFEFWLECNGKTFAGGCQNSNFFKLPDLDIKTNIFSKIFRTLTELAKGPEFGTFCKSKLMTNTILTNCHFNKLA